MLKKENNEKIIGKTEKSSLWDILHDIYFYRKFNNSDFLFCFIFSKIKYHVPEHTPRQNIELPKIKDVIIMLLKNETLLYNKDRFITIEYILNHHVIE